MSSLLFAVDPTLGRLDYSSLSDQARMEIVVENLNASCMFRNRNDTPESYYHDVCNWRGVTCNADGIVTKFQLCLYDLPVSDSFFHRIGDDIGGDAFITESLTDREEMYQGGSIAMEFLPDSVRVFKLKLLAAKGTLETMKLPHSLERFIVDGNRLHGTVDFCTLPKGLTEFVLSGNEFLGSCDFSLLPESLATLDLSRNRFEGSVKLDALPESLVMLCLDVNYLSGSVLITKLPPSIEQINISNNQFCGEFRLENLPASLRCVYAEHNRFEGTAVLPSAFRGFEITGNKIEAAVDELGNQMW